MRSFPCALLVGLLVSAAASVPTEKFVRSNYIKDDGPLYESGYPRVATNRFRRARLQENEELMPPGQYRSVGGHRVHVLEDGGDQAFVGSDHFAEAINRVVGCLPQLAQYRDELFVTERARLEDSEIISFYLMRFRDRADNVPLWLSSFVYLSGTRCAWFPEKPRVIDLDYGGSYRELWDVFDFARSRFVLIHRHDYEARTMELFRLDGRRFFRELRFTFSCLGCE